MNILVTNDDGIQKQGIHALASALGRLPDVKLYVFAPDSERTASSMALTVREPLRIKEWDRAEFGAEMAFAVSGTPVDCVRLAEHYLSERGIKIDLLCSGINHGYNIGGDVYFSGTVGAARQGVLRGMQAIAFSLEHHECMHFEIFDRIVPEVVTRTFGRVPSETLVNVNAPDLPAESIKGVKIASLGRYRLEERYVPHAEDPDCFDLKTKFFTAEVLSGPGSDVALLRQGYVTVTPIVINYVPEEAMRTAEGWNIEF